eukprot:TRINITY_DN17263_c0_g1_i1.p1 TRINITY_DN17263_c0_g1~~TRINITY_DN17263_c0_g1_i1.p1  ORF type:complete len:455 (-),score=135.73 TRINITY_DN17263_c0_g1_i1:9-1373(-)
MDWFGKDVKDNSLRRKLSEKPLTDTIINLLHILIRNKLRSIILFFIFIILFSIFFFKISHTEEDEERPKRDCPWVYKNKADSEYFKKRDDICQEFKMKNHERFRNKPFELSIVTVLPTRNDEEMYNIFQSALFSMESYLMKFPANIEMIIVEFGADQTFKRKLDIPCSFAKVERAFVGDWLIDSTYKKRAKNQQLWETQMAANVGLQRVTTNNTIVINYNDILTGSFFKNFRDLTNNLVTKPPNELPLIQPIPKRGVPFLFQGGVSPDKMTEHLDKVEWERVGAYELEIDTANKHNDFPTGDFGTTTWLTFKSTWDLIRGYPEVPINIDWQHIIECYIKDKIHPKIKTPKNFFPYIITLPQSSLQIHLWKNPHKLPNQNVWCKQIFLNSECWGIGNKLSRRTSYNYGSFGEEGDYKKVIDKEPQLRDCEHVRVQQRDFFTQLLAHPDTPKNLDK